MLPHCPESAGTARHVTGNVLREWGVDGEAIDQALLVVSELVTNALVHALPPIALHLQRFENDATLCVEVDDGGPADHAGNWSMSCTPEERGRGGGIIGLLATAHGTRILPHRVTSGQSCRPPAAIQTPFPHSRRATTTYAPRSHAKKEENLSADRSGRPRSRRAGAVGVDLFEHVST
ncbi:ATP-binding protein [Streptomyces sp. NPDC060334]|uniref:ATP-binding protein n=1 Tax=Streptomyces sp. NPDC060334 TaxID=3347099 RepID=UPI003653D761